MITQEQKEKNFELYIKKLKQVGVDLSLLDWFLPALKDASFTNSNEYGNAYQGSLIEIVLKVLTPYSVKLNELLPEDMRGDKKT